MKEKNLFKKLATKISKCRNKIATLAAVITMAIPQMAHAATTKTVNKDANAGGIVYDIADVVVGIFPFIGVFFVLAGVFKLVMAYRSDNPEGQSGAAKDIVIGIVFIAFRAFIWDAVAGAIFS